MWSRPARPAVSSGGTFLLPWSAVRVGSSMCLDVTGGDNSDDGVLLEQWACNGENQQFYFFNSAGNVMPGPTS